MAIFMILASLLGLSCIFAQRGEIVPPNRNRFKYDLLIISLKDGHWHDISEFLPTMVKSICFLDRMAVGYNIPKI